MKILVRSLERTVTEEELLKLFQEYGTVESCNLVLDAATGKSKGFAFVEMPNNEEAKQAIENLNGYTFSNRQITVNEARPKVENGNRGNFNNRDNRY